MSSEAIYKLKQHPSYYADMPHTAISKTDNKPHTPYTYLIGWSKLDIWYYGSKTAKGCHPSELFNYKLSISKRYETSSEEVKNTIISHGTPDVIQIRQIFNSASICFEWELNVLCKIDATHNLYFLNKTNGSGMNFSRTGMPLSDETKKKISVAHTGKIMSQDARDKMSLTRKGVPKPESFILGMTGENHPMFGKHHSEETKDKISASLTGENHPMFGNSHSEETKDRMSKAATGKKKSEEHIQHMKESKRGKLPAFDIIDNKFVMVALEDFYELKNIRYVGSTAKEAKAYKQSLLDKS